MIRITLVFITFLSFTVSAYSESKIIGRLPSFSNTSYRLVGEQSALNDFQGKLYSSGTVDAKGEFVAIINNKEETTVMLFVDRQFFKLWIVPQTDLTIIESNTTGYQFEGPAAQQNLFLLKAGIMMPNSLSTSLTTEKFEPILASSYLDSLETKRLSLLKTMFDHDKSYDNFLSFCSAEIRSFTCFSKSQYPAKFLYMDKTIKQTDIPASYYDFWNQFKVEEDNCLSDMYQNALRDYIGYQVTKKIGVEAVDFSKYVPVQLEQLNTILKDHPLTLQKQKTEAILFLIRYLDLPELSKMAVDQYQKDYKDHPATTLIKKEWESKLANSLTKVSFRLKDSQGKNVSSESLIGKVVYIDFWGSWCKACLAQWPNTKKLQTALDGKDIVFLFIDFYDTQEQWIKAINKYKMGGVHVKAEKQDEKYFNEVFGISNGFPRYAVLDRKGRLITPSAPHPNDESIIPFLQKILAEE